MRHVLPWYCADFGDFTSSQCCSPAAWAWQDTTRHSKGAAHPPTARVQHLQVATALLSCANLGGLLAVTWNPPWSTCINCELKRGCIGSEQGLKQMTVEEGGSLQFPQWFTFFYAFAVFPLLFECLLWCVRAQPQPNLECSYWGSLSSYPVNGCCTTDLSRSLVNGFSVLRKWIGSLPHLCST